MENESTNLESSQAPSLAQPLVFSNSKQSAISQPASGNSFSHHSMVRERRLSQRPGFGGRWFPNVLSAFGQYLKNPTDSSVHSPFTKRQAFTSTSTMIEVFMQEKQPVVTASTTVPAPPSSPLPSKTNPVPQMSPGSSDNQSSSPQPAQQKLKQQKKKASLTSKIPALAVEMPGSADISGLNLQFGALQFGSEPVLAECYRPRSEIRFPLCSQYHASQRRGVCIVLADDGQPTLNGSEQPEPQRGAPQYHHRPAQQHTSVESEASLHSSASTFSTSSSTVSAAPPVVSVSSSLSSVSSLGLSLSSNSTVTASTRSSVATTSGKAPPNLPPGVPPLLPNPYIMAPGLLHAYPPQVYGYDDLQMLQTRFPLPQQSQTQTHHTTQQTFLNPALPPGYSYTSLPYYTGVPGLPSTFQYGPAVFPVAPTSSKQHGVNVSVNASATPFQQPSGYGSHGYSTEPFKTLFSLCEDTSALYQVTRD
ncbi:ubiquitin-associated protein 2- hypothetical protein [Limosa lapponica baueri]|uniref:Ubiquitin-associated protein 2-like n=1 Tax=Limosa lapponica baueri TaxID=1758121 RepID=A0A2I0T8X3_LIMLA|nr:ubiquitin-associated protein 2- hypothetical protein [Limosa lapponica baueri]